MRRRRSSALLQPPARAVVFRRPRRPWSLPWDALAVLAALLLAALGVANLVAVHSETLARHQAAAVAVGLVLLVVLYFAPTRWLPLLGWGSYAVAVALLALVAAHGVSAYGARRWLSLGPFTFQPSELAKLALVIVLAVTLGPARPGWRRFAVGLAAAAVPIVLTARQPDLSTATVLTAITVLLLLLGRVAARYLLPLLGAVIVAAPLGIGLLAPYQLSRVTSFLAGPGGNAGSSWAVQQAHIAIASGGLFGMAQDPLHRVLAPYLPSRETDLALASLVEARGLVAAGLAVLATLVIVWRAAIVSRTTRHRAAGLIAAGFAALIGVETAISVGGNLGLVPLAGIPFPLLSYGGTAAVVTLAGLGLALGSGRLRQPSPLWATPRAHAPRPRLVRVAAVVMTAALLALTGYGWRLQRTQGAGLAASGLAQVTRCTPVPAARGMITDRHGVPLAYDEARMSVRVVPALIAGNRTTLARLSAAMGRPLAAIRRAATGAGTALQATVATVTPAVGRRLAAEHLPGVLVLPSPQRHYPYGALLGPLLGYVGVATPADIARLGALPPGELVGRAGLEAQYDALLRGIDGQQCVYVDPPGRPVALGPYRPPVAGATLRLTIDLSLQRELTAALAQALRGGVASPGGDLGAAVAMDPSTGAVLAMASAPAYDNRIFTPPVSAARLRAAARHGGDPMLEHATQAAAPPGSTFKLVVAAADVAHHVVAPSTVVPTGGSFTLAGHTFHNWAVLPPQDLVQAIAWSNDVYFYKLADALGADRLEATARELGVGQPTGIDLPGESGGYLGTPTTVRAIGGAWYAGSTVLLGIGQGYLTATPLQNARWTAGVATGRLVTPHLGLAYAASPGHLAALPFTAPQRLSFAAELGPVRAGMRAAVEQGTATLLQNLPVAAGAKTGTAEDATTGGRADSWFTAAAPISAPSIVVTSYVHGGGHGAQTSGPVVDQALRFFWTHRAQILAQG